MPVTPDTDVPSPPYIQGLTDNLFSKIQCYLIIVDWIILTRHQLLAHLKIILDIPTIIH